MDTQRFDELARAMVAGAVPRRRALRLLAGGAFAALFGRFGPAKVAARCGRLDDRCERNRDCCKGARCRRRRCRCKPGREDCGGAGRCETNLRTDEGNCGVCGGLCNEGLTCCGGECVNTSSNRRHCTACGRACPIGEFCFPNLGDPCCVSSGTGFGTRCRRSGPNRCCLADRGAFCKGPATGDEGNCCKPGGFSCSLSASEECCSGICTTDNLCQ